MSFLDYLMPKTLYKTWSAHSGEVKIFRMFGVTKLIFGGGVQSLKHDSPGIFRQYWGEAARLITHNVKQAKSILILGLGGGTIQYLLAKAYPGVKITSVEIDPAVIDAAKKYFDLDEISNHIVVQADCFDLLENPQAFNIYEKFDVILVDVNEKGLLSKVPAKTNYLKELSNLLASGGFIAFNFIVSQKDNSKGGILLDLVRTSFPHVSVLKVKNPAFADNWIFYDKSKTASVS
ncbi:MAG: methyltransferase domain-containing protein [Patescibacteria group bacterium]